MNALLRPQDFNSGLLKKRKQVINDEALKRQENLQAKFQLLESEFKKHENEKLFPELVPLKSSSELAFRKVLDEVRIAKTQKQKALQSLNVQFKGPQDSQMLSRPESQQREESLGIFNQQKFSRSYARFLSSTNNSYLTLRNEHTPSVLTEKIEALQCDFGKVQRIIEMERANEVSIRNRIAELSKSSININGEVARLRKSINEIEHRFRDVGIIEAIAGKKRDLAQLNYLHIKGEFEKISNNDTEVLGAIKTEHNQHDSHVNEEKTEFSKVLLEIEEKKELINQQTLESKNLDKEILEKQLKKMDSKWVVRYIEVLLQLDFLFLGSSVQTDEIESLYFKLQSSRTEASEYMDRSKRMSPKKRRSQEDCPSPFSPREEGWRSDREDQLIDRNLLMSSIERFDRRFPNGPEELASKLTHNYQILSMETDSFQRRYDELLALKSSRKHELEELEALLFSILTNNTHLLPDAFKRGHEGLTLILDNKSDAFTEFKPNKPAQNSQNPKAEALSDGNTINKLLMQIDDAQFHWRKKDLALIQNFTFKCYLSLTESLFRGAVLLELFMGKTQELDTDYELEAFYEKFMNKMIEYRKGFVIKRKNSALGAEANTLGSSNIGFEVNNDFTLNSQPAEERSNAENLAVDQLLHSESKKNRIFNFFNIQETALQPLPSNSVNGVASLSPPNRGSTQNNPNNSMIAPQTQTISNNISKNITLLNEIELYIPLGISELLEIFFQHFPEQELKETAEEWARQIKKDKTTSHFHSKDSLSAYLQNIKSQFPEEDSQRQALRTLENMIVLKEEALKIEMQRIREMMELYGEFIRIFSRRFEEKVNLETDSTNRHRRVTSKENTSEFVKKAFKEKCVTLMNKRGDRDREEELESKENKTEGGKEKKDTKNENKAEKRGLEEIKKSINELCKSLNNNSNFEFFTGRTSEKSIANTSILSTKAKSSGNPKGKSYFKTSFQQAINVNPTTTNESLVTHINTSNAIKKAVLKKSTTVKIDEKNKVPFEDEADSFEVERQNFKQEAEKFEMERSKPVVAKSQSGSTAFEKFSSKPNEDFKKIIDNHKIIHKLLNLQSRNSALEVKPFVFKGSLTPSSFPRKISTSGNSYDIKLNNHTIPDFHDSSNALQRSQLKPTKKSLENPPSNKTNSYVAKKALIEKKMKTEKPSNSMQRESQRSKSSRSKNARKNNRSDDVLGNLPTPYLPQNSNTPQSPGKRKDLINWGVTNANVFNNPGIYASLPFLMETRAEYPNSRNLLVDLLKSE